MAAPGDQVHLQGTLLHGRAAALVQGRSRGSRPAVLAEGVAHGWRVLPSCGVHPSPHRSLATARTATGGAASPRGRGSGAPARGARGACLHCVGAPCCTGTLLGTACPALQRSAAMQAGGDSAHAGCSMPLPAPTVCPGSEQTARPAPHRAPWRACILAGGACSGPAHLPRQHEAVQAVGLHQVQAGGVWQEDQGQQRAHHARGRGRVKGYLCVHLPREGGVAAQARGSRCYTEECDRTERSCARAARWQHGLRGSCIVMAAIAAALQPAAHMREDG